MNEFHLILIFGFVFGAAFGSFLNVIIYRVPRKIELDDIAIAREILNLPKDENSAEMEDLFRPSRCPKCSNKLKYRHNIPIFGWIMLLGKCFFCRDKISVQYPIIELFTAIGFTAIIYGFGLTVQGFSLIVLLCFFIPLCMIDFEHHILPDTMTLPLVWLGLALNTFNVFTDLQSAVWGAIFGYLSLWSVFWVYKLLTSKEGFGFGDFKLLAACGAWFGYQMLPYTIFISCIAGIILAIIMSIIKREKTTVLAFGPSIIFAVIFYLGTRENLYLWYNTNIFG